VAKRKTRNIDVHTKWSANGWVSATIGRRSAARAFLTQFEVDSAASKTAACDGAELIVHDEAGGIRDAMSFNRFEGTRTVKDSVVSGKKSKIACGRAAARAHSK
jgi:hypothetical protein